MLGLQKVLKPVLVRRVRRVRQGALPEPLVELLLELREPYLRKLQTLQALQAPAGHGEVIPHNSKGP